MFLFMADLLEARNSCQSLGVLFRRSLTIARGSILSLLASAKDDGIAADFANVALG
jgi:hypothetical protein